MYELMNFEEKVIRKINLPVISLYIDLFLKILMVVVFTGTGRINHIYKEGSHSLIQ